MIPFTVVTVGLVLCVLVTQGQSAMLVLVSRARGAGGVMVRRSVCGRSCFELPSLPGSRSWLRLRPWGLLLLIVVAFRLRLLLVVAAASIAIAVVVRGQRRMLCIRFGCSLLLRFTAAGVLRTLSAWGCDRMRGDWGLIGVGAVVAIFLSLWFLLLLNFFLLSRVL